MRNFFNSEYIAYLELGTPPQKVPILLDTGSPDIWVVSDLCETETCKSREQIYHSKSSTTFREGDREKIVGDSYGSGKIRGFEVADRLKLDQLVVPEMTFCSVTWLHLDNFQDLAFNGIVGLSYARISE